MRTLFFILLFFPIISFGQNKRIKFLSNYQIDKTYNGSKVSGHRKATIIFSDPKSMTKDGTSFEKLPKGYVIFKFEGLDQSKEEIIYLKSMDNQDIYAITNSETGNDIIYVMKYRHKIGDKSYTYSVVLGKTNESNLNAPLQYFTAFHCNLTD